VAKVYYINCRDVGVDCDFETRGLTIEEVLEHCAEHGKSQHGMRGLGIELFAKMRPHIRVVEEEPSST
jgi:predicted small metal-binding protein